MHNLNVQLFYFLNGVAGQYQSLDMLVVFLTTYLSYIVVFFVGIYVCFFVPAQKHSPIDRLRSIGQGVEFILSLLVTWVVVECIKVVVAHERPFVVLNNVISLVPTQTGFSFPSAHTALTFAVATLVYFSHRTLGIYLYVFAFVVGISRIYVGVHYPADVLVGIGLGCLVPQVLHRFFGQRMVPPVK